MAPSISDFVAVIPVREDELAEGFNASSNSGSSKYLLLWAADIDGECDHNPKGQVGY